MCHWISLLNYLGLTDLSWVYSCLWDLLTGSWNLAGLGGPQSTVWWLVDYQLGWWVWLGLLLQQAHLGLFTAWLGRFLKGGMETCKASAVQVCNCSLFLSLTPVVQIWSQGQSSVRDGELDHVFWGEEVCRMLTFLQPTTAEDSQVYEKLLSP